MGCFLTPKPLVCVVRDSLLRLGPRAERAGGRAAGESLPVFGRIKSLNYGKMSLVFGCIGTDLCKQTRFFPAFSKIYKITLLSS
jgi:hypothetical protein